MSKWINIDIENPLKTWWKARKYFKFPNISIKSAFRFEKSKLGKILNIECWDLMWKDKFRSPRHEINPHIYIDIFSFIHIYIEFTKTYLNEFGEKSNGDTMYWEYMLSYLYYKNNLKGYSTWQTDSKLYKYIDKYGNKEDGTEDIYKPFPLVLPCVSTSLNKKGIKQLKKELNESSGNN